MTSSTSQSNCSCFHQVSALLSDIIPYCSQNSSFTGKNYLFQQNLPSLLSTLKKIIQDLLSNSYSQSYLLNLEKSNRTYLHQIFNLQLQVSHLENKITYLSEIEEEFEEMKQKFKYQDGFFMWNDRKDNEIIIIRSENTKLKKLILNQEKQLEQLTIKIKEYESIISKIPKSKNNYLISTSSNSCSNGSTSSHTNKRSVLLTNQIQTNKEREKETKKKHLHNLLLQNLGEMKDRSKGSDSRINHTKLRQLNNFLIKSPSHKNVYQIKIIDKTPKYRNKETELISRWYMNWLSNNNLVSNSISSSQNNRALSGKKSMSAYSGRNKSVNNKNK